MQKIKIYLLSLYKKKVKQSSSNGVSQKSIPFNISQSETVVPVQLKESSSPFIIQKQTNRGYFSSSALNINDDISLEREADIMGSKVTNFSLNNSSSKTIQKKSIPAIKTIQLKKSKLEQNRLPTGGNIAGKTGQIGAALGVSGGVAGAMRAVEGGDIAHTSGASGLGALSVLSFGDAAMEFNNARKRKKEASEDEDTAGVKMSKHSRNRSVRNMATAALTGAKSGVNIAAGVVHGKDAVMNVSHISGAASYSSTALGAASAGLGIAGGALQVGTGGF